MDTEQHKKVKVPVPLELIEEILLRLSVKSLVRFRLLSKQCLSLLTDPQFIKSHHDLGAAPTNGILYMTLYRFGKEAEWVDVDASIRRCHVVRLPAPLYTAPAAIDSFRGFVLYESSLLGRSLVLWNPLTGVHKTLSYSSPHVPWSDYFCCGFGYDESTDDYLVVVRWCGGWESFSVRNNSWKQIIITYPPRFMRRFISSEGAYGVFFDRAIHWIATTEHDGVRSKVIIALDLVGKSISEIPLPDLRRGYFGKLMVLGGCLGVLSYREGRVRQLYKIWVMKEYKVHSTWTKYWANAIARRCFYRDGITFTPTLLSLPVDFGNARIDGH